MNVVPKWQTLLIALWGTSLCVNASYAGNEFEDPRQSLSPVTIDDKYLQPSIPAKAQQGVLTLHAAIEQAASNNREVLEARLQVSRFKWDYLAKETARLPNVRLISYLADQTITQQSPLVPARANAFVFMSALFPVTQQYRIGLEARAIKLGREIATERLKQCTDDTRALVKAAYYKLVLDESQLDDLKDSIKYLTELQKTVVEQVQRGNSLKVEGLEVASRLSKARFEETKATNEYNIDRESLNHLLGRDLKTPVALELIPPADGLEVNLEDAEQRALAMRAEIKQAELRVKQLRMERKIIWSEYIPNVSVGVVYITLPGFNNTIIPQNLLAPGIFINWNAFDWGRKAMLARAHSKLEQSARLTAHNTRDEVLIDLHKQINKLTESRQLIETAQLARLAARERMRVTLNRYKYTAERFSEVLQAQSTLAESNNAYHQALIAFWEAKTQFDRALGAD